MRVLDLSLNMNRHKANQLLWIFVMAWFVVRIVALFFIKEFKLFEVHDIALNMLQTGEMKYILHGQWNYNYQFPIYPSLLFVLYTLFGALPKLGIVLNCIFHSLSALAGYYFFTWISENSKIERIQQYSILLPLLGALGILFHPLINYYVLFNIHPFSLDLFLFFLSLLTMVYYFKKATFKNLIIFSLVFGITLLDRTTFVCLLIPFFIYQLYNSNLKIAFIQSIMVLGIGILLIIPWGYRNYSIYHKFSINSSLGQNLWLGIQEKTEGSTYLPDGRTYFYLLSEEEWQTIRELNSVEQSDYFVEKYKEDLSHNPMLFVKMYIIKLKNFWFFRKGMGMEYSESIKRFIPFYQIGYSIMLALTLFFLIRLKKNAFFLFSIPLALSLLHSFFYVETRHRILIEPILIYMAIVSMFILISLVDRKVHA